METFVTFLILAAVLALGFYYRDALQALHGARRHPNGHKIVNKQRKDTRHGLHLILSIVTLGMWVPVWFLVGLWNALGPRRKSVTRVR